MEIDIISGFLGSGKTTFINKYISCFNEDVVIIENEFGDIGLDASLINENIKVTELNSGCICCTLKGDFRNAIKEVYQNNIANKIIIEPSGISKLSYISSVCDLLKKFDHINVKLGKKIVLVDVSNFYDNLEDFGSFYTDQIIYADLIFLTNINQVEQDSLTNIKEAIKYLNNDVSIITEDFRQIINTKLLNIINNSSTNDSKLILEIDNDYHPDLSSFTLNINKKFSIDDFKTLENNIINGLYGNIIRAKGIINSTELSEKWHFDYTLNNFNTELMNDEKILKTDSRIIFIGSNLNYEAISNLNDSKKGLIK